MSERAATPSLYTISAHLAFADALARGVITQYGDDPLALARGLILLPNNRAIKAVRDAFVRQSGGGLLMPRLVPIGDEELGERLGSALDPLGEGLDIPPAIPAMDRQMILAHMVQQVRAEHRQPVDAGEAMRLAQALAQSIDQLHIEMVEPRRLKELPMAEELSGHWQASLRLLTILLDRWPEELNRLGMIDLADRRNRLLSHVAKRWKETPPSGFVIAAGIASVAPAVCDVLRTVSRMKNGQLVLAALDPSMSAEEWDAIGPFDADPVSGFRPRPQESHPQYAIKVMLNRIGAARDEIAQWNCGGGHDARAVRARNISNAMLVPAHTAKWRMLEKTERTLNGVRMMELPTPAQEAQAIALLLREALETKERTAALITPDRALAARVSAHLKRWNINADDSAGMPLSLTPPGTLLLALARVAAERFAPVALLDLLKHPLVRKGDERQDWLEQVRGLDLILRGPRPAPGLSGLAARLAPRAAGEQDRQAKLRARVAQWWADTQAHFVPLEGLAVDGTSLPHMLGTLRAIASDLSNDQIWAGHQGRALSDLFAEMERAAPSGPGHVEVEALPDLLARLLEGASVHPPQGGHPRIAIYGLLEARLQQADLMILAGLNEGTWPGIPSPDPWLAPRIRQLLGLPGLEQRIGLSAHDFASALGAPEVILSRARRSGSSPAIASRFWLRLQAMAGDHIEMLDTAPHWAGTIDAPARHTPTPRPQPCPPPALRPGALAVTQADRLAADPYAFYAGRILRLSPLERVDADPGPAWRGTHVHRVLELWFREDKCAPGRLETRTRDLFGQGDAHPILRALWMPRLLQSVRWIEEQVREDSAVEGRHIQLVETRGEITLGGITLSGTADRIDRLATGGIAIVDYKTGKPPSAKQVKQGFSLQLGLLGVIAEEGGFADLGKDTEAQKFEYWSTGKGKGGAFGYRVSPVKPGGSEKIIATEDFTRHATDQFLLAAGKWLTGDAPFTAQLNPDLPSYGEYDQLMRLEEWYGRGDSDGPSHHHSSGPSPASGGGRDND
ncbi:MAG: double-strand break repair protein AddB [Sphingobium sp.]|nr:double-strand break repair protein AddB [Sphingobium sp.]